MSYIKILSDLEGIDVDPSSLSEYNKLLDYVKGKCEEEIRKGLKLKKAPKDALNRLMRYEGSCGECNSGVVFFNRVMGVILNDSAWLGYAKTWSKVWDNTKSEKVYNQILNASYYSSDELYLPSVEDLSLFIKKFKPSEKCLINVEGHYFNARYFRDVLVLLGKNTVLRAESCETAPGYFRSKKGEAILFAVVYRGAIRKEHVYICKQNENEDE